jgi:hypothetical protein
LRSARSPFAPRQQNGLIYPLSDHRSRFATSRQACCSFFNLDRRSRGPGEAGPPEKKEADAELRREVGPERPPDPPDPHGGESPRPVVRRKRKGRKVERVPCDPAPTTIGDPAEDPPGACVSPLNSRKKGPGRTGDGTGGGGGRSPASPHPRTALSPVSTQLNK